MTSLIVTRRVGAWSAETSSVVRKIPMLSIIVVPVGSCMIKASPPVPDYAEHMLADWASQLGYSGM
jgi:hypothetical protein